jgi:uncharacterized protein
LIVTTLFFPGLSLPLAFSARRRMESRAFDGRGAKRGGEGDGRLTEKEPQMIKLNIAELLRTPGMNYHYPVHETLPSTPDLDYASPVVGYLDFHRTPNMLIIRGELEAAVREDCVRCLDEIITPIHADVEEEFDIENMKVVSNPNEEGNQSVEAFFKDQDLLLDEFIRQQLILEKPEYPVCAADCQGLCPHCGCNLNETECDCGETVESDSRWSPLAELYRNGKESG